MVDVFDEQLRAWQRRAVFGGEDLVRQTLQRVLRDGRVVRRAQDEANLVTDPQTTLPPDECEVAAELE
jgi:hypothetical protein